MKKIVLLTTTLFSLYAEYIHYPTFVNYNGLQVQKDDLIDEEISIFKKYKKTDFSSFKVYAGYSKYNHSPTKDNVKFGGFYYSYYSYPTKFELAIDGTLLKYKDSSSLKQEDGTLIEHYFIGSFSLKGGLHLIHSEDDLTNWGKIGIAGISFYKLNNYSISLDTYYSSYDNLSTSPKLLQFTLTANKFLNRYFYFSIGYNNIRLLKNYKENNLDNKYHYINSSLTFYMKNMSTTFSGWRGDRVFAVDKGGFVVSNLSNVESFGGSIKQTFKLDNNSNFDISYIFKKSIENNENVYQNGIVLGYSLFW